MRNIELTSKYNTYQPRRDLLMSLSKLISVIEYNFLDSGFYDLHDNIENMISSDEAEQIIDFIGYQAGIEDMYLLVDELQLETEIDLSPQTVLFIMISPLIHIEEQLNVDEEASQWLFDKLHVNYVADDLIGFMKELLLQAENNKIDDTGKMLS